MGVIVHLSTIYNEKYIQVQIHKYKYKHLNTNTAQKEGIKSRIGVIIHLDSNEKHFSSIMQIQALMIQIQPVMINFLNKIYYI